MEILEEVLNTIVQYAILFFEYVGVGVLIWSGIKGIWGYIRRRPSTRLDLAKGMAMAWSSNLAAKS